MRALFHVRRMVLTVGMLAAASASAATWQKLVGCRLGDTRTVRGDAFAVQHGDKSYVFKLYFVECPATDSRVAGKIPEQASHWGISEIKVPRIGQRAADFTRKALAGEFEVFTQWEKVGAEATPVFYAIVQVGGEDLAEKLMEAGLARVAGSTTAPPDGTSIESVFQKLQQRESHAKQNKLGAWGPDDEATVLGILGEPASGEPPPAITWPNVPTVAFLRAEAYVNTERFEEAEVEMRKLLQRFPEHPQRARIEFYLALSLAMQERFDPAIAQFKDWLNKYPDHIMVPEVRYWLPISLFYAGKYDEARPLFTQYAKDYAMSVYAPEAEYRAALCSYALEDYEAAANELEGWTQRNPEHYFKWEALVTWGDALAALGELDQSKSVYLRVTAAAGPFYYMALTQVAKVFKALGTPEAYLEMASVFTRFMQDSPQSDNIIDAAYQAGWALRQCGRAEDARKLYWVMLDRYGDAPKWEGFDILIKDLAGLYGDRPELYAAELRARQPQAETAKRTTLASRLAWAEAQIQPADQVMNQVAVFRSRFKSEFLGPETLAWLGDTLIQNGKTEDGIAYLEVLLASFPESRFASLANTRMADYRVRKKEFDKALTHADAVLAWAGEPLLIMEATFSRAQALQGLERYGEALADYNTILANRAAPRRLKPEALLNMAACLEAQGRWRQAIPYYQRVYVLYGAFTPAVAQAYLRSGQAFEQLKDIEAARRTYEEMLQLEAVSETAEAREAKQRLAKLGS